VSAEVSPSESVPGAEPYDIRRVHRSIGVVRPEFSIFERKEQVAAWAVDYIPGSGAVASQAGVGLGW
jgi:hypothetical protein